MLDKENKEILIKTGIIAGAVIVILTLLILMTFLARKSWERGLSDEVMTTLEQYSPGIYKDATFIELESNLASSAAVYALERKTSANSTGEYAVIVRVPGIAGPMPAVFIHSKNSKITEFAGYAVDNYKGKFVLSGEKSFGSLSYWQSKIERILEKAGV